MVEPSDQQSPEIFIQIQAAERRVEGMVQAAQQEAAAILDKARVQADTLLGEKRRSLERKKTEAEAKSVVEAERESEQLLENARIEADALKARCMGKMDEAVELVLKRVLPDWKRTGDSE